MINKDDLLKLIEPNFKKDLVQDSYEVKTIKANKLLRHIRFDLAFKLFFLEMIDKDAKLAKEVYKEHIRAFSLGKYTEPGNENKNSIDLFLKEFHKIFEDIRINGFDSTKTLIPLSKNSFIANGSHRVASAIFLSKKVKYVEIDTIDHIYDYKFFTSRNIASDILDAVATKFIEYAENIYIAFLWPIATGHDEKIESVIPNIVYRKEITLTPNGAHNLISQLYYGAEWLGSVEDNFMGSQGKLEQCFKGSGPLRIVAFQAGSLDEVLKIKECVRDIFKAGKHSIHITDTKQEAIKIARVVFNENSIHFLNYAKPNTYISTHEKMNKFKDFIRVNDLNVDELLIDSGMILSIYGLRQANDIDYFLDNNNKLKRSIEGIENNDETLKFHDKSKLELIYNPNNYFYFNDLKFTSFNQLYKMKKNRYEVRDRNDFKLMEALIENNSFKKLIIQTRQRFYYAKIKLKHNSLLFLKKYKLYEITRIVYRLIKRKN